MLVSIQRFQSAFKGAFKKTTEYSNNSNLLFLNNQLSVSIKPKQQLETATNQLVLFKQKPILVSLIRFYKNY